MQKKINKLAIFATAMTVLVLVLGSFAIYGPDNEVVPEGYKSASEVEAQLLNLTTQKDSVISTLTEQIAELPSQLADKTVVEVKESLGYIFDKVFLNSVVTETLSDREVKALFDGEVEFDGTNYDAEEVVVIDKMKVLVNEEDFEGTPYLVIPKSSVEYKIVFENSLNTSEITDEETLTFNLLGEEVEVSEWNGNSVTFSQGEEYLLTNGETKVVDNKTFILTNVLDGSIYVSVDGISKKVNEGETRTINGLEVQVKDVIYSDIGPVLMASVVLGEEVTKTVVNGDEYVEDSIWDYVITANSIGIVLDDEFNELDDELKPLAIEETVCLPNDYVCVRYNGFSETDFEELSFSLEDGYVEISGSFQIGLNDYDRLLINSTGVYNDDYEGLVGDVYVGSSDVELVVDLVAQTITVEDFEVDFNLNVSNVDVTADYSVRTDFGILVENPEDSVDEQSWNVNVPEEQLESTVTVL